MKNLLMLGFGLLFFVQATFAQEKKQIAVEGSSELKILPDEALVLVNLTEKALNTAGVTNALNKKAKAVSDALKKSGVEGYTFTADNYYVNVNRIYTKGTSKDSGYVATQQLRIVVKDTEKDLIKIVEQVQQAADMGFQLQFRISEERKKSYGEELLRLALQDAKRKAEVIADVMGISGVRVMQVDYSGRQSFQPVMYRAEAMMVKASEDRVAPTLDPDEQTISDNVRVIFSFE